MILTDFLKDQLDGTNSWLSFAEAKSAGLIAINIAIIGVVASILDDAMVFSVITIVVASISSFFTLLTFVPNLTNKPVEKENSFDETKANLIFYGDIAKIGNAEKYIELIKERYSNVRDEDSHLAGDIANEVIINSQITVHKYRLFTIALKVDYISILLLIVAFIVA